MIQVSSLPLWLLYGLVSLLLLLVGTFVIRRLHRKALQQELTNSFRIFFRRMYRPGSLMLLVLLGKMLVHAGLPLPHWLLNPVNHATTILMIGAGGWMVIGVLSAVKTKILRRHDMATADNLRARKIHTQFDVIYRIISFVVIVVTLAMMLLTFEQVAAIGQGLLASAGVAGIILGLAAQKTLGNVFAGIQIALTQPIRLEDAVVVEGEWGWIEEITLTYVVVRIWDLRRLVLPISYFTEKPFQNWTRKEAEIIGSVTIYTDYTVPVDAMRAQLDAVLEQTPLWNKRVKVLQVIDTTEHALVLRALMTGRDSPTTWDLRCFVREKLVEWLRREYPEALPKTRLDMDGAMQQFHAAMQNKNQILTK